jgi:hypothetical protein
MRTVIYFSREDLIKLQGLESFGEKYFNFLSELTRLPVKMLRDMFRDPYSSNPETHIWIRILNGELEWKRLDEKDGQDTVFFAVPVPKFLSGLVEVDGHPIF